MTIRDIAKELGISASTVSRALKDSTEISEDVRKKVQAFAELYHYKPNRLALNLRNRKTMVIGVIIPEIIHHFFSEVISGIEKVANSHEYNVMFCLSNESYDKEVENVKMLTENSVDGLIVSLSKETLLKKDCSHFQELIDSKIPLVLFDRVSEDIACDQVIADDIGGGYRATEHLINMGCRKIKIITTPDYVNVGRLRMQGYKNALKAHQFEIQNTNILKVDEKGDIKNQVAQVFEDRSHFPIGIFAVNEIYAATAMKVAKEKGFRIPEQVAIIGYTNGLISAYTDPPLSTIVQHGFFMGEQAAEILLKRINNKGEPPEKRQKVIISTNIVVRDSTEKPQKITV